MAETAAEKATRLAKEKAARIKAAKNSKRRLITVIKKDQADVSRLFEQVPSKALACQIDVFIGSWRESLKELAELDEILLNELDEDDDDFLNQEAAILSDRDELRKDLQIATAKLISIKETLETPTATSTPRRSVGANTSMFESGPGACIRLNDVPLPKFDGTYSDFPDWYNEFVSSVDRNEAYNGTQKLYLLKRCMVGKMQEAMKDVGTDPELYKPTLDGLHKTYFNRRRILAEHFANIVDMPVIKINTIRESVDKVKRAMRGIKVAGIDTPMMSPLIAFLVARKIPEKVRLDWDTSNHDFSTYPTFESMATFLINRSFAFESGSTGPIQNQVSSQLKNEPPKLVSKGKTMERKVSAAASNGTSSESGNRMCLLCDENHFLDQCNVFLKKSVIDRYNFVKSNSLCLKCLKKGHIVSVCKRNVKCSQCEKPHHRLLHRELVRDNSSNTGSNDNNGSGSSTQSGTGQGGTTSSVVSSGMTDSGRVVFLATAVVDVVGGNSTEKARVFIDQGSEMTLVSKEFCKRAKLVLCKNDVPISLIGITNNSIDVTQSVKCVIKSRFTDFSLAISADVINKIPYKVNRSNVSKAVEGLKYDFGETCELPYDTADILLGSEYAEFIFLDKRHFIEGLVLRESQFGYLITGSSTKCSFFGQKSSSFCGLSNLELSNQFRKFVEVEEIPDGKKEKIVEHELIDHHFESTYSIDRETNRFVVRLPLKDSVGILNGSFGKVCSMLVKSEKRRSVVVQKAYEDIFNEYLSLGHMTKISSIPDQRAYYMPHHVVSKGEDSHRIVFNASFMDNSGTSLNSHFLAGPKVQPDLVVNLIRFRWNLIGFICDIFRMYRDILIHPEDRIYQRIVFRFNFNDEIDTYELNTLANGIGPASYIAPKCLEKIATFIKDSDEIVSNILLRDLYMDNLATGSDTVADAVAINHRIYKVLLKYGFPLRKYQSNSPDFLAQISSELIDTVKVRNGKKFVMLLGLLWYLDADEIGVNIREEVLPSIVTKRVMLSVISKTFDIMGILMPITVRAKILLQELWKEGRDWDEEISIELREEFEAYCRDLVEVQSYTVPRCYFSSSSLTSTQLIGYCDASMRAACAVVYLRSIDIDGNVRVTFICSKSRLAPMKSTDIHRMELIATVLLAKLIASIRLELGVEKVYCFTDSQVALSWINIDPIKLKLFVSTRVKLVNSLVNKEHWFHIDGKLNPADLGTRGVSASKFMSLECWKNGPEILLSEDEFGRYVSDGFQVVGRVPELEVERTVSLLTYKNHHVLALLVRRSSLSICVAGLAYAIRFIRILKDKVKNRIVGTNRVVIEKRPIKELVALVPLVRMEEREDAFNNIIRASQHESFPNKCDKLSKGMEIGKESGLLSIDVFMDSNGILRSRGRTVNSSFSYETKFPIVLHAKSRLLELYLEMIHDKYFHANVSFMLNFVRSSYWVVGNLLSKIKKIIRLCIGCIRIKAKRNAQLMGDLPKDRFVISRPFTVVGVDFTGHFMLKCTNHRSVKNYKIYLAFFVCMCTRAVHIEVVGDLSTEGFINAFDRFSARRGLPNVMYSDNASNFVATKKVFDSSSFDSNYSKIKWNFIAPYSPHQGGAWEAAVKAGKSCLKKAIGNQRLNLLELFNIATKVEAILNARPISYRKSNAFVEPLTPGHFLIGTGMFEPPVDENADNLKIKSRYFLWRRIVDSFWSSWRHDYLNQLRIRSKWKTEERSLKVGDVVLIVSKDESVFEWPMGIVEQVYPDDRGLVRNVLVKSKGGGLKKSSVQNLVLLLENE